MTRSLTGPHSSARKADIAFRLVAGACAALLLAVMIGFFLRLLISAQPSIGHFGWGFFATTEWDPNALRFGALSSIYGTAASTLIALLIAAPLGLAIALFLTEIAPPWLSKVAGNAIELLAAVPSIIFGMWGLFVFAPFMAAHVEPALARAFNAVPLLNALPLFRGTPRGIDLLTSGTILALMVLPFISAVMRDIFLMVPPVVKESAHGMGATTWEVTRRVTVRYGIRGLVGACFLGLGRAIGETMAVTFVIGNSHRISASLLDPATSIASTLANEFAEASDPLYLSSLVQLGLILFVITFVLQVLAHVWLGRIAKSMGAP
jgi:phosphate transport system permease protein